MDRPVKQYSRRFSWLNCICCAWPRWQH